MPEKKKELDVHKLVKTLSEDMLHNLEQDDEAIAQLDQEEFERSLHVEPLQPTQREHKRENPKVGGSPFKDRQKMKGIKKPKEEEFDGE